MPEIELEPHEYGVSEKPRPAQPDDPVTLSIGIVIGLGLLGWAYWNREALAPNPALFFGFTAVFAFATGICFALLLKRLRID